MATMNPYDGVGTYTLPLATYDRFAYSYGFTYPSISKEAAILMQTSINYPEKPVIKLSDIASLREKSVNIHVDDKIPLYIAALLA